MSHSKVKPYDLVAAVRTKMATVPGAVVTANETIAEGIADLRVIQIYLSEFEGAKGSNTNRNTFGGGLQLRRFMVRVDVFSQPRSNLGEDISAAEKDCCSVIEVLEAQLTSPAFDLSGVHTFSWSGKLGVFPYAGSSYWGSQFSLEFMCH